jgi:hypothetical protein
MSKFAAQLTLLLLFAVAKPTLAQASFDGCVDFRGMPVVSIMNTSIQDVAMATYAPNGAPVIVYNPNVVVWLSAPTRLFFYAHECAHHVLAHEVRGNSLTQEQEADCWAIAYLIKIGMLGQNDVAEIQQDIARFGKADWIHLPGPVRAINLRFCLGGF